MRPTNPNYGKGTATLRLNVSELMLIDRQELETRFLEHLGAPDYLPPKLPEVALKLTELVQQPSCETQKIVALLETDPMLMAQVLKIAGSPIYSGVTELFSLRDVIVRLGRTTLSDIVMQAALSSKIFRVRHYKEVMESLNRHSTIVGHVAKKISQYTSTFGDYAFLCGLLHDIGTACVILVLADVPRGETAPNLEPLWPAIDAVHSRASELICQQWNLPTDISAVVGHHHDIMIQGYPHPLAAVVCLAEHVANEGGYNIKAPQPFDHSRPDLIERAKSVLRIDEAKWRLIEHESEKIFETFG